MAVKTIDINRCIGCGTCIESCPMDVFRLDTIVEIRPERSPCSMDCPLGVHQREYHNLIKLNMLNEAAELISNYHPMPAITGRVCPHPCETECSRSLVDKSININGLEQYLGDHLLTLTPAVSNMDNKDKIAVIGSGPAGLSAAYYLTLKGYNVTVFEKDQKPGGLLKSVIPSFRLPEDVLDRQIEYYKKMGITFKTGIMFGKDLNRADLKNKGYKAFVAATGAAKPLGLSVPGADAGGITNAVDFLRCVKSGSIKKIQGKVAVIGGGSVALDAARSAIRLGSDEVNVVCLERLEPGLKDSMLALTEEIEDSRAEGIIIHPSRGIDSFVTKDGHVRSIKCVECLSVRDEDGRFNPTYGDCVLPQEIEAETVILAIGQTADSKLVPEGFKINQRGYVIADALTKQVDTELFAAGDAVSGPSTVVEALAAGKRAALTIDRFLKGEDISAGLIDQSVRAEGPPKERFIYQADRIDRLTVPAAERKVNFNETVLPLSWKQAHMESERCLTCGSRSKIAYLDDCQVCRLCEHYCPTDAIDITDGAVMGSLHAFNVVSLG
jgi:NADPH-dependent glutamate synthase beta subunit-like oxidoreductase